MTDLTFYTLVLTSNERGNVVVDVIDGDGDRGGGRAAGGHPPHVLSFNHHHVLVLGLPVQSVCLAADHTCAETVTRMDRR